MATISHLKNTTPNVKECKFFSSWSKALNILRDGLVATTAEDNGAMDVYKDDTGNIHVRVHRHLITIYEESFKTRVAAKPIVTHWMSEIK